MGLLGLQTLGVESVGQIPAVYRPYPAGFLPHRRALARRLGHRGDELHRDDRGRACLLCE